MKNHTTIWALTTMLAFTYASLGAAVLFAQPPNPATDRVKTVLTTPLPPHLQGDSLRATLLAVKYGPGEGSRPHVHGCPVIVYVLEGRVRSQVRGQREAIYGAGESFYEAPGRVHAVSANASNEKPARFLAFFVCDRDVPLSSNPPVPLPGAGK